MQEIFYNGNIVTGNDKNEVCSGMLINDGSIVFVGQEREVLELKTEETQVHGLNKKYIYPTLFDLNANVFEKIDKKIKNANQDKIFQNSDEIDENYENFSDFQIYKKEYKELEKDYIKNGIATIIETKIDKREFAFWKKMSEEKQLKIDVLGFVDLAHSKQVMDDNCVTYRKYRNHFRLGGYYLKIDGKVHELKAWLKKSYAGTKTHHGSSEFYGEQLYFLIKTALDEKKQILFDVNGDKAIEEVLTVLEEIETKEKISNFYRPVFYGASVVNKSCFEKLKKYDVTLLFENFDETTQKNIKRYIGFSRRKYFHNYKVLLKNQVRFVCLNKQFDKQNFDSFISELKLKKRKIYSKMLKNDKYFNKITKILQNLFLYNPAYICFDQEFKASFETQKQASFVCLKNSIFSEKFDYEKDLDFVYINGEREF